MVLEAYAKIRGELCGEKPNLYTTQLAWTVTQVMHNKAIYHFDPITIEIVMEEDLENDDDIEIGLLVKSEALDATWESGRERFSLDGTMTEQDIRDSVNRSIDYLIDSHACDIDRGMPDKPWTVGIDPVTAAWAKQKLSRQEILALLKSLSSSGYTTYPDPRDGKVTSKGYKITGGASIRMLGLIATSSIDLGQGVNYRNGIITVPGTVPETIQSRIMGKDASKVIDHPLIAGAGIVRKIFEGRDADDDNIIETSFILERTIIDIDIFMSEIGSQQGTWTGSDEFS